MTTELATTTVSDNQLDLVRKTIAANASPEELELFLYDCKRRGVHPLDKLLHFTKRGGKYVPICSIDLMRTRAADSGEYAGNDDAVFTGTIGKDFAATVTVWRLVQGQRCPFTATARLSEYMPPAGQDSMWRKMPHVMLAKCAEALALRKAFPAQLGALYVGEELDQAGRQEDPRALAEDAPAPAVKAAPRNVTPPTGDTRTITEAQQRRLFGIAKTAGHELPLVKQWLQDVCGFAHSNQITRGAYESICTRLENPTPLTADLFGDDLPLPDEEPGADG